MIEAGLGGRYDATNVIPSKVAGAHRRGPRAHALAGPDDRRHRRGEAGSGARPLDAGGGARPAPGGAGGGRAGGGRAPRPLVTAPGCPAAPFQRRNFSARLRRRRGVPRARARTPARSRRAVSGDPHPGPARGGGRAAADGPRRRPQPGRGRGPGGGAAGGRRASGGRSVLVASVLDDKDAAGMLGALLPALRPRGVHPLREPAGAVAGHAGVAGGEARRAAVGDRRRAARGRGPRPGDRRARRARWWPPARST